jgi:hypothetical protein
MQAGRSFALAAAAVAISLLAVIRAAAQKKYDTGAMFVGVPRL